MKLSVIIPTYNAATTIAQQLDALSQENWSEPWEIIIADNGSTDNTLEIVHRYQEILPHLRIVDASKLTGPSHARNIGANAALGEALAFCDADDVIEPGWIAAMGEALSCHDFVGGRDEFWKLNELWLIKNYQVEHGTGVAFQHPYLPYKGAGNLGIKRSLHEAVGGFDETMVFLEDCDYCWRVQLRGVDLKEEANAIIQVRLRGNIQSVMRREYRLGLAEPLLFKKHEAFGFPKMVYFTTWITALIRFVRDMITLKIRDRTIFNGWLKHFAYLVGLAQGCIQFGYVPGISRPRRFKHKQQQTINPPKHASV